MIYLATVSGPSVRALIHAGALGQMLTPAAGHRPVEHAAMAADNGCFSDRWSPDRWWPWLQRMAKEPLLFAVCPDVVGDAAATAKLWADWHPSMHSLGIPVAWVAQNGADQRSIPVEADAVFIGGDTAYKLGPAASRIAREAKASGRWLHMGRVNSLRRLRYAHALGCDSVDGTFLAYGPDVNTPKLLRFLRWAHEPTLPFGEA